MNTNQIKLLRILRAHTPARVRPLIGRLLPEQTKATMKNALEPRYFFVRGHPRSGTNWVSKLLNLHPHIWCEGEFHFDTIYYALEISKNVPWQLTSHEPVRSTLDAAFADLVRRCIDVACRPQRPYALWYGDRSPRDLIHWLPGGRYIWVLRDGRDVAVSWTFHQLRLGRKVIKQAHFSAEIKDCLFDLSALFMQNHNFFRDHPEQLLANEVWVKQIASDWNRQFIIDSDEAALLKRPEVNGRVLLVRYEDLHADTQAQCDRLYRFLDLDPAMAEPFSSDTNTTPGFSRHDPNAHQRNGAIGDWKNYFTDEALLWFNEIAGQSLVDAGYATTSDRTCEPTFASSDQ